jgi:hypothetical protein
MSYPKDFAILLQTLVEYSIGYDLGHMVMAVVVVCTDDVFVVDEWVK